MNRAKRLVEASRHYTFTNNALKLTILVLLIAAAAAAGYVFRLVLRTDVIYSHFK